MSLLTALVVKNRIYFIFLKRRARSTLKDIQYRESSYQVRQILVFFCKLVALILCYNSSTEEIFILGGGLNTLQ